jgi:cyclophilin family peptidyl-prolyl cis-trans isomerase
MVIVRSLATLLAVNLSAAGLAACGDSGGASTTSALPFGCKEVPRPKPKRVELPRPRREVPPDSKLEATVDTSCGSFGIALDAATSPRTVSSFVYLARKGAYAGTSFQRIVPGFVIQGGDPTESGEGGPGYSVTEAPPPNTEYTRGTVAMVKPQLAPRGRSGSQFFVVTAADAGLPPNYAVLGKVSSGWPTVRRIASLGDPASGQIGTPRATVAIRRITVSSR